MFKNKFKNNNVENKICRFIWGTTNVCEPQNNVGNLHTMNDIDIIYYKKSKNIS